ncbi:MAG: HD-GYP domain-containing protein [Gemmatimonadaceae bacterium]|nr:HD-GYP domain-containing protein [Gemmatimonadaceae bacterium]
MSKIERYVFAIAAAAVTAAAVLYSRSPSVTSEFVRVAIVFGSISLLARTLSHRIAKHTSGSLAFIPMLAGAAMAPSWTIVVSAALSAVVEQIIARKEWRKTLFNTAQYALSVAVAVLAYHAAGGRALHSIGEATAASLIILFLVFFLTNSLCVSGAISISTGEHFVEVWKRGTLGELPYDFLALPVVLFFIWIFTAFGALGAFFLAVPILGIRQLYIVNSRLEQTNRELLELMVAAIEARDTYTSGHSRRVAASAKIIARAIGLRYRDVQRIGIAALLHDVGKIHDVFGPILSKPGRLTPEENAIMKTHPIKSEELARTVTELSDVLPMIRHHHENWDGSGYPDQLANNAIPLGSRIIMFADTIDAMTTDRPYRAALGEAAVRSELQRFRGTQFDPLIYDRLLASPDFSLLFRSGESGARTHPGVREGIVGATTLA